LSAVFQVGLFILWFYLKLPSFLSSTKHNLVLSDNDVCRVRKLRQPDECSDGDTGDERISDWNETTQSATEETKRDKST